jgi:hypothetical protein
MKVVVINVGSPEYCKFSLPLIQSLCDYNKIPLEVITEAIPQCNLHPSWIKIFLHSMCDEDFILCWDLDLMPTKLYDIHQFLDISKINLAYDKYVVHNGSALYGPNFKYNCGLLGIPKQYGPPIEKVYERRHQNRACYEQFYVNDLIAENNYPVHVLPNTLNDMYCIGRPVRPLNQHYTYNVYDEQTRYNLMKEHYEKYSKLF